MSLVPVGKDGGKDGRCCDASGAMGVRGDDRPSLPDPGLNTGMIAKGLLLRITAHLQTEGVSVSGKGGKG